MICALAPGKPAETLMVGNPPAATEPPAKRERDGAHHGHADGEKRGAYRPLDEWRRNVHAFSASGAARCRTMPVRDDGP